MNNPFEIIENRLSAIESLLIDIKHKTLDFKKEGKFSDLPELMTRKQAAAVIGVSLGTLDSWAKEGRLTKVRAGGIVRFRKDELLANFRSLKESRYQRF